MASLVPETSTRARRRLGPPGANPSRKHQPLRGDWTRVFDGLVYTGVMVPSTAAAR